MKKLRITICLAALLAIAISAHAEDFTRTDNEHLDVATIYDSGNLSNFSTYDVLTGGDARVYNDDIVNVTYESFSSLCAYDSSTINMSGGSMLWLCAYDSSTINKSGGSVSWLQAHNNSTASMSGGSAIWLIAQDSGILSMSGGSTQYLLAYNSSIINISGGIADEVAAYDTSTVIFYGYGFTLGDGLSWDIDGQTILGTGILTGTWFNNTGFEISINYQNTFATIMAIPEPATIVLISLASLFLHKKNRR